MAKESRFIPTLIIFFFSSSIVALGVHELHESSMSLKSTSRGSSNSIVQELHGGSSPARASFSPSSGSKDSTSSGESLDRKDRIELRKLLDKVSH